MQFSANPEKDVINTQDYFDYFSLYIRQINVIKSAKKMFSLYKTHAISL